MAFLPKKALKLLPCALRMLSSSSTSSCRLLHQVNQINSSSSS